MNERELEEKVVKKLGVIEPGLILIERQKRVTTGVIDLLCKDKKGNYVLIELKRKPDTKVISQVARYYMALIQEGYKKNQLRTIIVAQEFPKNVLEVCSFFNFETKQIYREKSSKNSPKKESSSEFFQDNFLEELLNFIKRKGYVNVSMIAKRFDIYHATASDFVNYLDSKKLVTIEKLGGQNIVRVVSKK